MSIALLILSIIAILLSIANLALWLDTRKQNDRRHCAMLDYTDRKYDGLMDAALCNAEEQVEKQMIEMRCEISKYAERIEHLENGITPDYEKAMAAANAVNEFNAGISAIMAYDPIEIARARRLNAEMEVE